MLAEIPNSIERCLLQKGMVAMQGCSRPIKATTKPNPNVIHSLEVIISENKLGSGGFGEVFEANWRGTVVAVKVLAEDVPESVRHHYFLLI